jgi:aerobic carbon-monoxide dehydrogenase medium subunit
VPMRPGGGSAYQKVERRAGDWAVAAAGACVWLGGDSFTAVGIGLTAVGAENFCAPEAEDSLRGAAASDDAINAAGELAAANCNPVTDQRGPADYKRHLAGELTKRALRLAVARALGEEA